MLSLSLIYSFPHDGVRLSHCIVYEGCSKNYVYFVIKIEWEVITTLNVALFFFRCTSLCVSV
jgi:hypothetical protein